MVSDAYQNFDAELRASYRRLDLRHINEIEEFDGKNVYAFFSDIACERTAVHPLPYSEFKIHDELNFISQDLKYIVGILYILRPRINNTHRDQGCYYQTVEDHRYLMHVSFGFQVVYNFWDRLGDMLWYYFPSNLAERDVFFDRIIKQIPPPYSNSVNFTELLEIYNKHAKSLLDTRKQVVHYFQIETLHYWGNIQHMNPQRRLELYTEKFNYADVLSEQLKYLSTAFYYALKLIEELPAIVRPINS